jgi:hypothetical protein
MPLDEATALFTGVHMRVGQQLAQKGLQGNARPPVIRNQQGQEEAYNGYLPSDLTQIDDNGLGWYLGMLSGWLEYVQQQLAEASAGMTVANAKLEFANATLLMIHKKDHLDKKRPEPERKAMVLIDRRYVEAQAEAMYHETYYRYVNAIFKAADQNYTAVSRRITQRQQDIERQKRSTGVGNITGPLFRQP